MNTTEKVKKHILKHPEQTARESAKATGSTYNYVKKLKVQLRKEGKLPPADLTLNRKPTTEDDIKTGIKKLFKKKDIHTLESLSNHFDIGIGKVKNLMDDLISQGHNFKIESGQVLFSNVIPKSDSKILDVKKMSTGFYRFGALGDTHLGSKYERMDVLNGLYKIFQEEGIKDVYHTGNYIDGEARFNKHDLIVHGLDNQINYFLENYPQLKGINTHYITGDDHEGWYTQREGINVGKYTQQKAEDAGRKDLHFLGHMEGDIILKAPKGQTIVRVLHPGGGSSYAISYTSQKIVESYTGGEKPDILLDGHYHKAGYNYIRGVHVVQTGCTQDQTPFMRKKRLAAHLGGWIIEFAVDNQGAVTRFKKEFIPFYDNAYYKKWGYKW
jgi:hypothetical protein